MCAKHTKVHMGRHGYEATYDLIHTSGGGEIDPPQKRFTQTVHSRVIGSPGPGAHNPRLCRVMDSCLD